MRAGVTADDVMQAVVEREALLLHDQRAAAQHGPLLKYCDGGASVSEQRARRQTG
ncbi:MAG: hypothetical protein BroJett007_28970 [Chloroflexota bacterium]|nr:MAG: hypothetical protein BroJett007_28970 [Chloroflexota bacterium]